MDRTALQQLLAEAEVVIHRDEQSIDHQRDVIRTLAQRGHDVAGARSQLRRMEARQARHIAERNRLFKELADSEGNDAPHGNRRS